MVCNTNVPLGIQPSLTTERWLKISGTGTIPLQLASCFQSLVESLSLFFCLSLLEDIQSFAFLIRIICEQVFCLIPDHKLKKSLKLTKVYFTHFPVDHGEFQSGTEHKKQRQKPVNAKRFFARPAVQKPAHFRVVEFHLFLFVLIFYLNHTFLSNQIQGQSQE